MSQKRVFHTTLQTIAKRNSDLKPYLYYYFVMNNEGYRVQTKPGTYLCLTSFCLIKA